jgi:heme/copper-type cytochrome/quinol oxidase subunit 3
VERRKERGNEAELWRRELRIRRRANPLRGRRHNTRNTRTILHGNSRKFFTIFQAYEYVEAPFTIADSSYGSTFFVATGFHGLHVIIGTTFLLTFYHHFGFEAVTVS